MTNSNFVNYFNEQFSKLPVLESALQQSQQWLQQFANRSDFAEKMQEAFGDDINVANLQETWANGNFGTVPNLEVLPSEDINGARGAFARETNTIYLSEELINEEDSEDVASVFLEEYGHYIDSELSASESNGDEGDLFAAFVQNKNLSSKQIEQKQTEDDTAVASLDGQTISIEQLHQPIDSIGGGSNDNELPQVENEISDQTITTGEQFDYGISTTFSDPDDDTLTYELVGDDPDWLEFEYGFRSVYPDLTGTPDEGDAGIYDIEVQASDGNGGSVTEKFTLNVEEPNEPPQVEEGFSNQSVTAGEEFNNNLYNAFSDPDDRDSLLNYELVGDDPDWLEFEYGFRSVYPDLTGTPDEGDTGSYDIEVKASDGDGGSVTEKFTLNVEEPNEQPQVDNGISDQTITAGEQFDYGISTTFSDPDDDTLTYELVGDDPDWLEFEYGFGLYPDLTGTPDEGDAGSYDIEVQASDGNGGSVTEELTLTVEEPNEPPQVEQGISDQTITAGEDFDEPIYNTFSDPDGDSLNYELVGEDPDWLNVYGRTRYSSEKLDGNPEEGDAGSYDIEVKASDGKGGSVIEEFTLNVEEPNQPPQVEEGISDQTVNAGKVKYLYDVIRDQRVTLGENFTYDIDDTFSDPDGDSLDYELVGEQPDWLNIYGYSERLYGDPSESDAGSYEIEVQASDGNGGSVSEQFTLKVEEPSNKPPQVEEKISDQTIAAGENFTYDIDNAFSDPDDNSLQYFAQPSPEESFRFEPPYPGLDWLNFDELSGKLSATPDESRAGVSLNLRIIASDGNGGYVSEDFTLNVEEPNQPPQVTTPLSDRDIPEGEYSGISVSENFSDPDGDDDDLTYEVSSPNDDSLHPDVTGWLSFNNDGNIFAEPEQGDNGSYALEVTAQDPEGETASSQFVLNVNASNEAPEVETPISDRDISEGESDNFSVNDAFSDPDGDDEDLTYQVSSANSDSLLPPVMGWVDINNDTGQLKVEPERGNHGSYALEVTAEDPKGKTANSQFVLNVNAAPQVETPLPDRNISEGESDNFSVNDAFSDPDGDDEDLTYQVSSANSNDLPPSVAGWVDINNDTGQLNVEPEQGNHGTYALEVTAEDPKGASVSEQFTINVEDTVSVQPGTTNLNDPNLTETGLELGNVQDFSFQEAANFVNDRKSFLESTVIKGGDLEDDILTISETASTVALGLALASVSSGAAIPILAGSALSLALGEKLDLLDDDFDLGKDTDLSTSVVLPPDYQMVEQGPRQGPRDSPKQTIEIQTGDEIIIRGSVFPGKNKDQIDQLIIDKRGSEERPKKIDLLGTSNDFIPTTFRTDELTFTEEGTYEIRLMTEDDETKQFSLGNTQTIKATSSPNDDPYDIPQPNKLNRDLLGPSEPKSRGSVSDEVIELNKQENLSNISFSSQQLTFKEAATFAKATQGELKVAGNPILQEVISVGIEEIVDASSFQAFASGSLIGLITNRVGEFDLGGDTDINTSLITPLSSQEKADRENANGDITLQTGTEFIINGTILPGVSKDQIKRIEVSQRPEGNQQTFRPIANTEIEIGEKDVVPNLITSNIATFTEPGTYEIKLANKQGTYKQEKNVQYVTVEESSGPPEKFTRVNNPVSDLTITAQEGESFDFRLPQNTFLGDNLNYKINNPFEDSPSVTPTNKFFDLLEVEKDQFRGGVSGSSLKVTGEIPENFFPPYEPRSIDVELIAQDSEFEKDSASTEFTITLVEGNNKAPQLDNGLSDQSVTAGEEFSYWIPSDAFSDPDGRDDTLTFELVGNNPDWLNLEYGLRSVYPELTGTPPESNVGDFDIEIKAKDSDGGSVSEQFTINVNQPPQVKNGLSNQSITAGDEFSYWIPSDAFSNPDGGDNSLSFELVGDNPDWLNLEYGLRSVYPELTGTPPESDTNSYDIEVKASDGNGGSVREEFTLNVEEPNEALTITSSATPQVEENSTNVVSLQADDPDGDAIAFSVTGGADQNQFTIKDNNQLQFNSAPNFENPNDDNGDNRYQVQVTADDGNGGTTTQQLEMKVADVNETTNLALTPATLEQQEGNSSNTPYTFTLTRTDNTTGETTVSYEVTGSGDNPANAQDFGGSFPSDTVTFADGETEKEISIEVAGDSQLESDETFNVELSNPSEGAELTNGTATGTILNDDVATSTVSLNVPNQTATEGGSPATVELTRTNSNSVLNVELNVSGSASNNDYSFSQGSFNDSTLTLSFAEGEQTINLEVTATDDSENEQQEQLNLNLASSSNYTIDENNQTAVIDLADNNQGNNGELNLVEGSTGRNRLAGTEEDDRILGKESRDLIRGGKGDDVINPGPGRDVMVGQAGEDQFVLKPGHGPNQIRDLTLGEDELALGEQLSFADLGISNTRTGTRIAVEESDEVLADLFGIQAENVNESDFTAMA